MEPKRKNVCVVDAAGTPLGRTQSMPGASSPTRTTKSIVVRTTNEFLAVRTKRKS